MCNIKLTEIYKSLFEVRVINPDSYKSNPKPLKDSETIRVYHGFSSYSSEVAKVIARYGVTGKVRARRIYSYESGNNPKGLFVTIDHKVAMDRFAGSGIVMEFHVKVKDLEAPVWKSDNGSYFVQGQMTKSFKDADEREKARMMQRDKHSEHELDFISKSDRPELAYTIFLNPEHQALFVGDLNPNMIRAFWVNERLMYDRMTDGSWDRMSRKEFIDQYPIKKHTDVVSKRKSYPREYHRAKNKFFRPADDFSLEKLKDIFFDKMVYNDEKDEEELQDFITRLVNDDESINYFMYPKQIKQFRKMFKHLKES